MQTFKIFYSWQSDLPGNKTRSLIRECIDEAIDLAQDSEAIEAERDEATLRTTGSPNIVTTLFSKIDDCDLFIADLSLCFSEDQKGEKKSPNPNVMLELGYAVKTLGWERVLCLCNTDFGEQYPFDIAHNRITNFSLERHSRKEVKSDIAKIIFINIRDIRKQPPRAKLGIATHIIGTYDYETREIVRSLKPIDIGGQERFLLHNQEIIEQSKSLLAEIQKITSHMGTTTPIKPQQIKVEKDISSHPELPEASSFVHVLAESYKSSESPIVWEDKESVVKRIKDWLNVDVSDDFFDLHGLKKTTSLFSMGTSTLSGTDEEKQKYYKLQKLSYNLLTLEVRTNYLRTFDGIYYIPLAIQNISTILDTDIRVVVNIEVGEIVEPDEHLIWEEYEGLQKYICRNDDDKTDVGIISELFTLSEDGNIHVEDVPYDFSINMPRVPIITAQGLSYPDKSEQDYKQELEEFIATAGGLGYYEFDVNNLRPGECKWLSYGMLIKPVDGKVKIRYQIHSAHSTGSISDFIEANIT